MLYRIVTHSLKPVTDTVKQVVEMAAVLVVIEMFACFTETISLVIARRL